VRRAAPAVAGLLLLAGCSHHHRHPQVGRPANEPGSPCQVVGVAYVDSLRPRGLTFEDIVLDRAPHRSIVAVGAGLEFAVGSIRVPSLGPYGPAVDYLASRAAGKPVGRPSAEVLASARRLDTDLAKGLCAGFRTGSGS